MKYRSRTFDWCIDPERLKKYNGKTRQEIRELYQKNAQRLFASVEFVKTVKGKANIINVMDEEKRIEYLKIERDINFIGGHLNDGQKWSTTGYFMQYPSGKKKLRDQNNGRKI